MVSLTRRQQQVYDFLVACVRENGYPPTLQEIAAELGVAGNLGVLRHLAALERVGLIRRSRGSSRGISLVDRPDAAGACLPLIGTVRAGQPQLAQEDIDGYFRVDDSLVKSPGSFLLRVRGDSMIEAHIVDGDLAVVRPQQTAENGEIVVAMIDGEATLKRFYRDGGRIRLQPANVTMTPLIIPAETAEVVIVGKVTGLCRRLD